MRVFETLRREMEAGVLGTVKDWLAGHLDPGRFRQTLGGVAERTRDGESFLDAVREFLDEFSLRPEDLRARALADPPAATGDSRYDAFLGGLAEHLALAHGAPVPRWALEPARFCETFWFVSAVPGFRALQLARSPAAFRRRGIFLDPDALTRV